MILQIIINLHSKMSYQNQNFGMMDEGYFVPRGEILSWLNNLLHLNLTKIEQLGSGAVYCQVIDVIHPGKVSMSKVNWKARNDYEFINNLKVLQNAFDKIGIKRHVEVQKLAKAKYQDNLEFIQWLKRYYDLNCGERGNNYMPEERRGNVAVNLGFADKNVVPKTYNAGGVVKNQSNLPGQKKKTTSHVTQAPKRIKSPPGRKPAEPKKTITTVKTETATKCEQHATNTSEIRQENNADKEMNESLMKALEDASMELEKMKEEVNDYKQKYKQAGMKVQMIREIVKSEDDAVMKVTLIQQIIKD